MNECTKSGCRSLEWKCADCGRIASTATIAKIPRVWEWIKCSDRMPELEEKVLFYVLDREQIYAGYFTKDKHRSLEQSEKFRENLDDWWFDEETITHWMPLPKPPEPK